MASHRTVNDLKEAPAAKRLRLWRHCCALWTATHIETLPPSEIAFLKSMDPDTPRERDSLLAILSVSDKALLKLIGSYLPYCRFCGQVNSHDKLLWEPNFLTAKDLGPTHLMDNQPNILMEHETAARHYQKVEPYLRGEGDSDESWTVTRRARELCISKTEDWETLGGSVSWCGVPCAVARFKFGQLSKPRLGKCEDRTYINFFHSIPREGAYAVAAEFEGRVTSRTVGVVFITDEGKVHLTLVHPRLDPITITNAERVMDLVYMHDDLIPLVYIINEVAHHLGRPIKMAIFKHDQQDLNHDIATLHEQGIAQRHGYLRLAKEDKGGYIITQ